MRLRLLLLGAALAATLASPATSRPGLARGPYLQSVTGTSAAVVFDTATPAEAWVEFGTTRELGRKVTGAAGRHHCLTLKGLDPGSLVYYRVGIGEAPASPLSRFHTAARPGASFRFAALGDCGSGFAVQRRLAARMQEDEPEFVLVTGDVVYEKGSQAEYDRKFFPIYRTLLSRAAWFPALGNHDLGTRGGAPFLDNFHLPNNERWYSLDWGDVHLVALDSTSPLGPGTPQDRWLAQDLASARSAWKIAWFHHPPYTKAKHEPSLPVRKAWVPLFERYGVQLVLNGHNHVYERTRPIRGVTYVVTGGGGASLHGARPADFLEVSDSRHHYLRLQASPERLSWEAVDADGRVLDRAELSSSPR